MDQADHPSEGGDDLSGPLISDTLRNDLRDIHLLEDALGKQLARLRAKRHRLLVARAPMAEKQITDHAIVRWLERHEGMDIEKIKTDIRAYIAQCEQTEVKGVLRHPDGLEVIVDKKGVVVTIVPSDHPGYPTRDWSEDDE